LLYYEGDKGANIGERKDIAEKLRISMDTLRVRVHRIKSILKKCALECLKREK
jgi:DNA-directed RNA polymerase specialized sigma24 family protein